MKTGRGFSVWSLGSIASYCFGSRLISPLPLGRHKMPPMYTVICCLQDLGLCNFLRDFRWAYKRRDHIRGVLKTGIENRYKKELVIAL